MFANVALRLSRRVVLHQARCVSLTVAVQKKGKREKQGKGGSGERHKHNLEPPPELLDVEVVRAEMSEAVDHFVTLLARQLTVRQDVRAYEQLLLALPSGEVPLNHVATVKLKSANLVIINFTDAHAIQAARDALDKSGLSSNPQQQGSTLLLPLPRVSRERREELAKSGNTLLNQDLVANLRKIYERNSKTTNDLKSAGGASHDDVFAAVETLQRLRKEAFAQGQAALKSKQEQLLAEIH